MIKSGDELQVVAAFDGLKVGLEFFIQYLPHSYKFLAHKIILTLQLADHCRLQQPLLSVVIVQ